MDTGDKTRVIGVAFVWSVWGIICLFWDLEGTSFGEDFLGSMFHLMFYMATLFMILAGGRWFVVDGADYIGHWWDNRKKSTS